MGFVIRYHHLTEWIVQASGQSDKFVHVQVGLILWLLVAAALRRRLSSPLPLAAVILIEVVNEVLDRLYSGSWNWPDTIGDAAATWAWPAALTLILLIDQGRGAPGVRSRTPDPDPEPATERNLVQIERTLH